MKPHHGVGVAAEPQRDGGKEGGGGQPQDDAAQAAPPSQVATGHQYAADECAQTAED